jgi:hypothetical protein
VIRNWYLNEQIFAQDEAEGEGYYSLAMLCPTCGKLWGREELEGQPWQAISAFCEAHGGGHLLSNFTLDCLADGHEWSKYSPKVLGYEVSLLLKERNDGRSDGFEQSADSDGTDGGQGIIRGALRNGEDLRDRDGS